LDKDQKKPQCVNTRYNPKDYGDWVQKNWPCNERDPIKGTDEKHVVSGYDKKLGCGRESKKKDRGCVLINGIPKCVCWHSGHLVWEKESFWRPRRGEWRKRYFVLDKDKNPPQCANRAEYHHYHLTKVEQKAFDEMNARSAGVSLCIRKELGDWRREKAASRGSMRWRKAARMAIRRPSPLELKSVALNLVKTELKAMKILGATELDAIVEAQKWTQEELVALIQQLDVSDERKKSVEDHAAEIINRYKKCKSDRGYASEKTKKMQELLQHLEEGTAVNKWHPEQCKQVAREGAKLALGTTVLAGGVLGILACCSVSVPVFGIAAVATIAVVSAGIMVWDWKLSQKEARLKKEFNEFVVILQRVIIGLDSVNDILEKLQKLIAKIRNYKAPLVEAILSHDAVKEALQDPGRKSNNGEKQESIRTMLMKNLDDSPFKKEYTAIAGRAPSDGKPTMKKDRRCTDLIEGSEVLDDRWKEAYDVSFLKDFANLKTEQQKREWYAKYKRWSPEDFFFLSAPANVRNPLERDVNERDRKWFKEENGRPPTDSELAEYKRTNKYKQLKILYEYNQRKLAYEGYKNISYATWADGWMTVDEFMKKWVNESGAEMNSTQANKWNPLMNKAKNQNFVSNWRKEKTAVCGTVKLLVSVEELSWQLKQAVEVLFNKYKLPEKVVDLINRLNEFWKLPKVCRMPSHCKAGGNFWSRFLRKETYKQKKEAKCQKKIMEEKCRGPFPTGEMPEECFKEPAKTKFENEIQQRCQEQFDQECRKEFEIKLKKPACTKKMKNKDYLQKRRRVDAQIRSLYDLNLGIAALGFVVGGVAFGGSLAGGFVKTAVNATTAATESSAAMTAQAALASTEVAEGVLAADILAQATTSVAASSEAAALDLGFILSNGGAGQSTLGGQIQISMDTLANLISIEDLRETDIPHDVLARNRTANVSNWQAVKDTACICVYNDGC